MKIKINESEEYFWAVENKDTFDYRKDAHYAVKPSDKNKYIEKGYDVLTWDEYYSLVKRTDDEGIGDWTEISEDAYFKQLYVLPPLKYKDGGFFLSEPMSYNVYRFYQEYNKRYYTSLQRISTPRDDIIDSLKQSIKQNTVVSETLEIKESNDNYFRLTHKNNGMYQALLVKADTREEAKAKYIKEIPDGEIIGISKATPNEVDACKHRGMPIIDEAWSWDDDMEIERDYENELWVCHQCLQAIESHEGKQMYAEVDVDFDNPQESKCDWCEEYGFDTLYIIGK